MGAIRVPLNERIAKVLSLQDPVDQFYYIKRMEFGWPENTMTWTRMLQKLRWKTAGKEYDWDFKITTEYDKHGNNLWPISMIDVACPPGLDLMKASYDAYRLIIGASFVQMVPNKLQWYSGLSAFETYTRSEKIEIESCHEKMNKDLEKQFWRPDSRYNHTYLQGYNIIEEEGLATADTHFSLFVRLRADSDLYYGNKTVGMEGDWTFYIEWQPRDQFYYIKRIEFGCPQEVDVQRNYRNLNYPHYWKISTGIVLEKELKPLDPEPY
ncbi:unnamed protein product [Caenorhabditis sp. 36 PRJEB53466]|nr:unnamed protein product [Caenorhabditis sp. 36 PRJEB53466]